ncbi:MAG: Ig-like domain-containing protein [Patescibacteria group bacterium]
MFKITTSFLFALIAYFVIFSAPPAQAAGWVAQSSGITTNLRSMDMVDSAVGFAVGDGGKILKTTNGGQTWSVVYTGSGDIYYGIDMVSANTGWAVGLSGKIIKTTDGGSNWSIQGAGVTTNLLYDVSAVNSLEAAAVGAGGIVLRTTDGGANWTLLQSDLAAILYGVKFSSCVVQPNPSGRCIWAVGANGVIVRAAYPNVSDTPAWTTQSSGTTVSLNEIEHWPATGNLYVVGAGGTVLGTTDYGLNWTKVQTTTLQFGFESVASLSGPKLIAVGGPGAIFKGIQSGGSWGWSAESSGTSQTLYGVSAKTNAASFIDAWAVGAGGVILRYDETPPNPPSGLIKTTANSDNTPSFTWLASLDDVSGTYGTGVIKYEYSVDGAAYVNNGNNLSLTLSILADGAHSISVRAMDTAANNSQVSTVNFTINTAPADTSAPSGSFTINGGVGATNSTSVSLSLTCTDNIGCMQMQVSTDGTLDTEPWEAYAASKSVSIPSGDGSKFVRIKFKDAAGNTSPQSNVSIILDTTTQDTVISSSSKPAQSTTATTAAFAFGFTGTSITSVTFECKFDSGSFSSCASPITYGSLSVGSHTFQVRTIDAAGNIDLSPDSYTWTIVSSPVTVDTTAPATPTGAQKVSNDSDATPTFVWNAASDNVGVANYFIQIDNGSLIDIGNSTSYTIPSNLANGSHTFKVLAKDAAGNMSSVNSLSFTVNTAAPVICPLTLEKAYKISTSKAVYYITTDCTKRPFKNGQSFFTYFDSWSEVIVTTQAILNSIADDSLGFTPAGPKYDPKYGALVKIVTDPKVYLLLGTEKYWIISESVFTGLKYDWKWIEDVDPKLLNKYSVGSEITYTDHHPNYTIIKYAAFANVYRLEPDPSDYSKQVKRWIKNEKVFTALNFRWDRIVTVPDTEVYKDGKIMDESEVNL